MKSLYIQVPKTHSTHREKWPGCVCCVLQHCNYTKW